MRTAPKTPKSRVFDKLPPDFAELSYVLSLDFQREYIRNLSVVLMTGTVMMSLGWVGYVGSDDHSYARGALGWLNYFPYVGDNHWTLRHTVVIPIAASLAIFGYREISLALPSAAMFLLFLAINYHYLARYFGTEFALLTSAFLATIPLFVVQATFPQDVIAQLLPVSISFWFFYSATHEPRPAWLMFVAGVAAGFAWLTIETAAGLLMFNGILFLIGFGVPRRCYWTIAFGFLLVVAIEVTYLTVRTGDPLYRYRIDLSHDLVDRIGDITVATRLGSVLNSEGSLAFNVWLEPITTLLVNQEFGLLFWAYVPAAIWTCRTKTIPIEHRCILRLINGLGLVWMAFVSFNASVLYIVPRYYSVSTWAAVIVVIYWLRHFLYLRWRKTAVITGFILMIVNLLCVYVENKNPLFVERALVEHVLEHRNTVYTDPMTMTRAKLLLEFKGVSDHVLSSPARPGVLFYANLNNIERCRRLESKCKWRWDDYVPKANWMEQARIKPDRKLSGRMLSLFGFDKFIPKEIFDRLDRPNSGGIFYLVPSERLGQQTINK